MVLRGEILSCVNTIATKLFTNSYLKVSLFMARHMLVTFYHSGEND